MRSRKSILVRGKNNDQWNRQVYRSTVILVFFTYFAKFGIVLDLNNQLIVSC